MKTQVLITNGPTLSCCGVSRDKCLCGSKLPSTDRTRPRRYTCRRDGRDDYPRDWGELGEALERDADRHGEAPVAKSVWPKVGESRTTYDKNGEPLTFDLAKVCAGATYDPAGQPLVFDLQKEADGK